MQEVKRYQIRGVPGEVVRTRLGDRTVDHWSPIGGSEHLLIAHDGQNIFDGTTSTHTSQTWKMAQRKIVGEVPTRTAAFLAQNWLSAPKWGSIGPWPKKL